MACRTLFRSCWDGRVNACIRRRSGSGIDHQGLGLVAGIVWGVGATPSTGGVAVYMIQYSGRGAFSPISTRKVW